MNVADLAGLELDYWVARSLHDFVREIHFTDSGETVSIRGNDRGRPWDGRFTPSISWEAAAVVLERVQRVEIRERARSGAVKCMVVFEGAARAVEAAGVSLRIALLRAFVANQFGDTVDVMRRQPQTVFGVLVDWVGEQADARGSGDPQPDGAIGDIKTIPR
jgi:hypothetical protein